MDSKERKILHLKLGLALINILRERKAVSNENKINGIKDHKLVSSLRKLAAGSAIDFGSIQKISKGDQGLEFFTFIDIIDALGLDMTSFGKYFNAITQDQVDEYQISIQKSRKEKKK
jgi:hypothetical protein